MMLKKRLGRWWLIFPLVTAAVVIIGYLLLASASRGSPFRGLAPGAVANTPTVTITVPAPPEYPTQTLSPTPTLPAVPPPLGGTPVPPPSPEATAVPPKATATVTAKPAGKPTAVRPCRYTAKAGDSWSTVAKALGVAVGPLMQKNPTGNPAQPGTVFVSPSPDCH